MQWHQRTRTGARKRGGVRERSSRCFESLIGYSNESCWGTSKRAGERAQVQGMWWGVIRLYNLKNHVKWVHATPTKSALYVRVQAAHLWQKIFYTRLSTRACQEGTSQYPPKAFMPLLPQRLWEDKLHGKAHRRMYTEAKRANRRRQQQCFT